MRVVAYITTNFAPIIISEHLFFQWLCQHLVDVQNWHTYKEFCLSWVSCLSKQSADVGIDDVTMYVKVKIKKYINKKNKKTKKEYS